MRSAKHRHHSTECRTILSHVNCFIHGEVLDFRYCWIVFIHVVRGRPGGLLQFSKGEAVNIFLFLAFVSSGILAVWPYREKRKRCAWTVDTSRRTGLAAVNAVRSVSFMTSDDRLSLWHYNWRHPQNSDRWHERQTLVLESLAYWTTIWNGTDMLMQVARKLLFVYTFLTFALPH